MLLELLKKFIKFVKNLFGYKDEEEQEKRKEDINTILRRGKSRFDRKWNQNPKSQVSLSNFELIKTLGKGKFGRIMLIRKKETDPPLFFALKIMNKRTALMSGCAECVIYEKRILQSIHYPFLVRYKYHFKDNANCYLVLEYVAGGDMFTHIRRAYRFSDNLTKFYMSQITLSLEYLHHLGIVHRDLKPENIMIDHEGFIKITDFGLAKYIGSGQTSTKCGTRVYMAPEILTMKRTSYSFNADWWPVGVMLFEMITGQVPFEANNNLELIYKIEKHAVRYPSYMHSSTKKMIRGLLNPNLERRYVTSEEVKTKEYFKNTDWFALYKKQVHPPFIPTIRSMMDTSNFDNFKEEKIEEWAEDVYAEEFKDF